MITEDGWYGQGDAYPYEKAATYQLKTYITFALVGIHKIENEDSTDVCLFDNKVQYYRYYLDNVLYCLGQIHSRFTRIERVSPERQEAKELKNYSVDINKANYRFSKEAFPTLSVKLPRNIVEHIDERNLLSIKSYDGVGGFNVIFDNNNPELIKSIFSRQECYPYTLDLRDMSVHFYDIQSKKVTGRKSVLSLYKLKDELKQLKQNVNNFESILQYCI